MTDASPSSLAGNLRAAETAAQRPANPPPDPQSWEAISDPWERLRAALSAFYEYYAATERMWTPSHHDVASVTTLQKPMTDFAAFATEIADDLAKPLRPGPRQARPVKATVQHALAFLTWQDLRKRGLTNPKKVELVVAWLSGITRNSRN